MSVALYAALLLAVALGRLVELRRSAANESALRAEGGADVDSAGFREMVALHVALFVLPLSEVTLLERPFDWRIGGPALAALAAATALRLAVIRALGRFWSARAVVSPVTAVCARGPFRFVRHPNYVAVAAEMLALPLVHGAWISAAALSLWNAAVLARRVRAEERALFRVPGYTEAMGHKARFIPFVF